MKAGRGPNLHDKNPHSVGSGLAELQGLGGAHHDVDDGDHEPGEDKEGHQPVDVLYMLTCRGPPPQLATTPSAAQNSCTPQLIVTCLGIIWHSESHS